MVRTGAIADAKTVMPPQWTALKDPSSRSRDCARDRLKREVVSFQ
jgi:hypothetical protein